MLSVLLLALLSLPAGAEPAAEATAKTQERERQQAVSVMAPAKAKGLRIESGNMSRRVAQLHPDPLLRWSNPTAGSVYGEVFLWSLDERPVAMGSIYRWYEPYKDSTMELTSLSDSSIELKESDRLVWKTPARGIEFRRLGEATAPAGARGARLAQMRAIVKRFAAQLIDERSGEDVTRQLRALNQPLYRYVSKENHIVDGAIFVFAEATDPEVLLTVEAVTEKDETYWRYALARMNAHEVAVRLDQKTVQEWKRVVGTGIDPQETYMYLTFDPRLVKISTPSTSAP